MRGLPDGYSVGRVVALRGGCELREGHAPAGPAVVLARSLPGGLAPSYAHTLACASLLEGARRQEALGEGWAGVRSYGSGPDGAWVARADAGVPVGLLAASGRAFAHDELKAIVRGVGAAATAYHEAYGSACGAVDPARVLVPAKGPIRAGSVVLTDPVPGRESPEADVAALGELICRLVERTGPRQPVNYPAQPGAGWKRVGLAGERWRAYANGLMDPRARSRGELPAMGDAVAAVPSEPADVWKPVRYAAVVAVIAGAGWGGWYLWQQQQVSALEAERLRAPLMVLCENYDALVALRGASWEGNWGEGDGVPAVVVSDLESFRAGVLGPVTAEGGDPFRPNRYFQQFGGDTAALYERIQDETTEWLRGELKKSERDDIDAATASLAEAVAAWNAWSAREGLREWAAAAGEAGRGAIASEARRARGVDIDPEAGGGAPLLPTPEEVAGVLGARAASVAIDRADALAAELERLAAGVGATGPVSSVVAAARGALASELSTVGDLEAGAAFARRWSAAVEPMAAVLRESERYDLALLDGSPEAQDRAAAVAGGVGTDTALAATRGLAAEAAGYEVLTGSADPRPMARLATLRAAIEEQIERLRLLAGDEALPYERELRELTAARSAYEALPVVRKEVETLTARGGELVAQHDDLRQRALETADAYDTPIPELLANMQAWLSASDGPRLEASREAWSALLARGRANESAFTQPGNREGGAWRQAERALRDVIEWAEGGGEAGNALRPVIAPGLVEGFDGSVVEAAQDAEADRAASAVVARAGAMAMDGQPPKRSGEAVAGVIAAQREAVEAWAARAEGYLRSAAAARALLDAGYLPDQPGPGGESAAGLLAWSDSDEAVASSISGAAASVTGRVAAIERVRAARDPATLGRLIEGAVVESSPAVYMAAWEALGSMGPGADPAATAERSAEVIAAVRGWEATGASAGFRGSVLTSASARWVSLAQAVGDRATLEGVLALAGRFGVDRDGLPGEATLRWNLDVYRLAASLEGVEDDEAARAVLTSWAREATPPSGRVEADAWYAEIGDLASGDEKPVDYATIGPAVTGGRGWREGWTFDEGRSEFEAGTKQPRRLVYRYEGRDRRRVPDLVFHLVPGREGLPPVLLSETEVSLGLMHGVAGGLSEDVLGGLPDQRAVEGRSRQAPWIWYCTWRGSTGGRIGVVGSERLWLGNQSSVSTFPEGGEPDRPAWDTPVQNINAGQALTVAQALGCRLPTAEEFSAALRAWHDGAVIDPGGAVEAGRLVANLRDATWRRQYDHAAAARAASNTLLRFTPNLGGLVSEPEGEDGEVAVEGRTDGYIWYCPVDSGLDGLGGSARVVGPKHLIGNVAEWVLRTGDPQAYEVAPDASPERSQGLLGRLDGVAGVMGCSAITPPMPADRVIEPDAGDDVYSDVGFRLALAPEGRWRTIAQVVLGELERAYVLGGPGSG